jgi:hypothetical protein
MNYGYPFFLSMKHQFSKIERLEIVEQIIAKIGKISDRLTFNQKLFAGLILDNLEVDDPLGCEWLRSALGFKSLPEAETPAQRAVAYISAYKRQKSLQNSDSLVASVSLLKAINQYDDLLIAADFLQAASDIFGQTAKSLEPKCIR